MPSRRVEPPGGRADSSAPPVRHARSALIVTTLYGLLVVLTSIAHEPWRDEVGPLVVAREAGSIAELAQTVRFEGHPILWYALLRIAYGVIGSTAALKVASLLFAIPAVYVFVSRSPFPLWARVLVPFSFLPIYQYSVVSRSYSVSMCLVVLACAGYPARRERPLRLATVLALLANCHAFGVIIAVAMGAMWVLDEVLDWRAGQASRHAVAAMAIVLAGVVLSVWLAFPDPEFSASGVRQIGIGAALTAILQATAFPLAGSVPLLFLPGASLLAWCLYLTLLPRPSILAFAALALTGIETVFLLIWPPGPWHMGNALLAMLAALWLYLDSVKADGGDPSGPVAPLRRVARWVGYVGIVFLLGTQLLRGITAVHEDLRGAHSSSRSLAQLITDDPALSNAVVIGDPDTLILSLPYYAENRLYIAREGAFRNRMHVTQERRWTYSLTELTRAAQGVRDDCGCPVIVALGWDLAEAKVHRRYDGSPFEMTLAITEESRAEFESQARKIATVRDATMTDENYDVYVLEAPPE